MKKNILKLAKELITIQSTKDHYGNLDKTVLVANRYLSGYKNKKFKSKEIPSVIFYNQATLPEKFKIILNAHLDVVPAKKTQYKPVIKKDKLYGRGAYDMKAAAAVEILVFKELAKKVNYPLGLQLVTDEEIGGFDGTKHQIEKGIRTDFVITGEPTNFNITTMTKGILWIKISAEGYSAHGARPWKGKNAIQLLNNALNKLCKKYPTPKKEVWATTINVGKALSTNNTFNKVPDYAEAWIDTRYIPEEEKTVLNNIKRILPKSIQIEVVLKEPPHKITGGQKYINFLKKSVKNYSNKNSKILKQHGSNDVRHFTNVGCNGVEFGPIGSGLHTDNEWVSIKSLEDYYEILKDFLIKL